MTDQVTLTTVDNVGIIALDNPPVNGLSFAVRRGLADTIDEALTDDNIEAIVVTGAGAMFCGGADIRQFGQTPPPNAANLPQIIDQMEAGSKPVVAAIHGVAAGGGLEVALGCHHRLATMNTRVGLPEVTLGFVPGAGGTVRLPRLIGVRKALEIIVSGRLLPAKEAQTVGILDRLVEGGVENLRAEAVAFARGLVGNPDAVRRTCDREDGLCEARDNPQLFDEFRASIAKRSRGYRAPYACIECIHRAVSLPFNDAVRKERETFVGLVASHESKALRHAFFAEREASKVPDVPRDTPTRRIETAGVIGCGTMGGGIAMSFANAGIPVTVFENSRAALDRGVAVVTKNYAATVTKGRMSQSIMDQRMALISPTMSHADLAGADIVVEAVFEDLDLKQEIFRALDATCQPETILATNTSTLDVNALAAATGRPHQVIGTHFFSPAHVMRLVECVRGQATSVETIASVRQLSKRLGKVGVLVGVCDGFVGNRMLYAYRRQAEFLLEEGALPQDIDRVLFEFGFPMGPFQTADLAGLDVGWRVRQRQAATRPAHLRYSPIADRIYERGRLGQKTGAGWYRYKPGQRTPIPDPVVETLIADVATEQGIQRQPVAHDDIVPRCLYPLVNEGAKILSEGLALRASDIDVIWLHGYGFPRYRGGPMFWADHVGLGTVYDTMSRLAEQHGEWLEPAPLLADLAASGKRFRDL